MSESKEQPIRLSHSTMDLFNRCERLFQMEKLLITASERDETAHTVFGTAFGVGVAEYLVSQDQSKALYKAWLAYWPELETDKKSMTILTDALIKAFPALNSMLEEYEVVQFNGKPATELSFRINISPRYYYVGYIDAVLRNRFDGTCMAIDAKTTGLNLLDLSPLYKNSGQVLGYSIAIDKIVGEKVANYAVGYFVAQVGKDFACKIHPLVFNKTLLDRLNWFITLGGDVKRLELAEELGFYPRRGNSCLMYNRPCKFFGICTLSAGDVPKKIEEDEIEYDFVFDLDDLVNDHLERINT